MSTAERVDSVTLAVRVRRDVIEMTHKARASHVGSCLSVVDILAVLYSEVMVHEPENPGSSKRDRLVMSKGHAAAALYAVLAEVGYCELDELQTYCANGSKLCGHVTRGAVPGVEVSTGSLGHGLSIGVGMALSSLRSKRGDRVFVILSDGECDEGSVWEAAMFASHHRLSNLVAIVDYNKLQSMGTVESTLGLEPFADKWSSFGWSVFEVDGHDHGQLASALSPKRSEGPRCVVAHTTKGKGVPFMESDGVLWHYRAPDDRELGEALAYLDT